MSLLPVYVLRADSDATVCLRTSLDFFDNRFDGEPLAKDWAPPLLQILNKTKPLKDFIGFDLSAPAISERARAALEPLIGPHCEFLPLVQFGATMYYAVNVLLVVDCLDWEKSDILYREDGKSIAIGHRYVFVPDRLPNAAIFRAAPHGAVFVRPAFVECVIQNNLTNAIFGDPAIDPFPLIVAGKEVNVVPGVPR